MTGVSIQRPTPPTDRRIRRNIQPASGSTIGGHTQLNQVIVSYPGVYSRSAMPQTPIAAAGTAAQRWGRFVWCTVSTAMSAQPNAKASRIEPVMTLSPLPANTTRVRVAAAPRPAAMEPATMRATGPVRGGVVGT